MSLALAVVEIFHRVQNSKTVIWPWPRPFQGIFFIGRLGLAMFNLCTKFKVPVCRRYEDMNGGAKCKNWGSLGQLWVTHGHPQCYHSIERIRLPIRLNRNHASILYRFRNIASYLSKAPILTHPTCIWRPRRGWTRSNFAEIFGNGKLDSLGYRVVLFVWSCV